VVSAILTEERHRSTPDKIVEHEFFSQGEYLERLDASIAMSVPPPPTHGPEHNQLLYRQYCMLAGVRLGGLVFGGHDL
jgi:hypothetical protein